MSSTAFRLFFGFVLGVLSTAACFVWHDTFKIGSALVATIFSVSSESVLLCVILVNLLVLDVILVLPRLRFVRKVADIRRHIVAFKVSINGIPIPRILPRLRYLFVVVADVMHFFVALMGSLGVIRIPCPLSHLRRIWAEIKQVTNIWKQYIPMFKISRPVILLFIIVKKAGTYTSRRIASFKVSRGAPAGKRNGVLEFKEPIPWSASTANIAMTLLLVFCNQLLRKAADSSPTALVLVVDDVVHSQAWAVDDDAGYEQGFPGAYDMACDSLMVKQSICLLPLLLACACAALTDIVWPPFSFVYGLVRSSVRVRNRSASSEVNENADITLVDDNGPQSSEGDKETSPASRIHLSTSKSAPVSVTSLVHHSQLRRSTSCQLRIDVSPFIPSSSSIHPVDIAIAVTLKASGSAPKVTATVVDTPVRKPVLNPSVTAFVPTPRPIIPAKQDWQPVKPLSFQWARGGCVTRITAPPTPTSLKVSAPPFVPQAQHKPATPFMPSVVNEDADRAGLSASMWAPKAPVAEVCPVPLPVLVKKPLVLRSAAPDFWAPGGCPVRIVAPSASPPSK